MDPLSSPETFTGPLWNKYMQNVRMYNFPLPVPHLQYPVHVMPAVKESFFVSLFFLFQNLSVASILDMILRITVSQILHVTLLLYKQLPDGNTEKIHLTSVT